MKSVYDAAENRTRQAVTAKPGASIPRLVTPRGPCNNSLGSVTLAGQSERTLTMLSSQEVMRYVKAEPFRPFRIHMASGRTFDIRHPEMVRVGKASLVIFTFVSENPEIYDNWDTVGLLLIETISHLDSAVSQP
jgi:hypothetical protein